MSDIEKLALAIVKGVADTIGIEGLLKIVFAHAGADRSKAVLEQEMNATDSAMDTLEDEKFGPL